MELNKKIIELTNKLTSNKYLEVIKEGNELIKKYPNLFIFYNIVGLAYQGLVRLEESEKFFLKAIEINPKEVGPKNNLANTYYSLGKLEESEKLFEEILSKLGRSPVVLVNYSRVKKKLNDFNKAKNLLEEALNLDKNNLEFLEELANCHQSLGNFEKSKEICNKILDKNPNNIPVHIILSKQTDYSKENANLKKMIDAETILDEKNINKYKICFAIGKAYEDKKKIERSFDYIKEANDLQDNLIQYKIYKDELVFKNVKNLFDNNKFFFPKEKYNKKKIIFICGLPRSGTTLVEQILSSHTKVNGAGELVYLKKSIDTLFLNNENINKYKIESEINSEKNILNDMYFKFLKIHNFKNEFVSDKAPQNFMWIGFIKYFFPNAKVVHCYRNAYDNFLSLYKNNFASNQHMGWTFNPDNIVKFYNMYSDLMNFWKSKFGDFIYNINYDKLVTENKTEIKKLLNYCELEKEDNCFNHHKNKNPITTVSLYQARKPIYKSSLNSSETFKQYLEKYFKLLNKLD